jgi:hypothetical protein
VVQQALSAVRLKSISHLETIMAEEERKVWLKLTGGERYVGPRTDNKLLERGQVHSFSEIDAEEVLSITNSDASNNEYPLFTEVDGPEDADVRETMEIPVQRSRLRARTPAVVVAKRIARKAA